MTDSISGTGSSRGVSEIKDPGTQEKIKDSKLSKFSAERKRMFSLLKSKFFAVGKRFGLVRSSQNNASVKNISGSHANTSALNALSLDVQEAIAKADDIIAKNSPARTDAQQSRFDQATELKKYLAPRLAQIHTGSGATQGEMVAELQENLPEVLNRLSRLETTLVDAFEALASLEKGAVSVAELKKNMSILISRLSDTSDGVPLTSAVKDTIVQLEGMREKADTMDETQRKYVNVTMKQLLAINPAKDFDAIDALI